MKYAVFLLTMVLLGCGGGGSSNAPTGGSSVGLVAKKIGSVPGPGACGVSNAYSVTEVSGVRLTQAATLNRRTAERLNGWIASRAKPIVGNKGGGLVAIQVAAHYACRTRNNQRGAKLSEHGKGNAIDISAFILADGTRMTVLNDCFIKTISTSTPLTTAVAPSAASRLTDRQTRRRRNGDDPQTHHTAAKAEFGIQRVGLPAHQSQSALQRPGGFFRQHTA